VTRRGALDSGGYVIVATRDRDHRSDRDECAVRIVTRTVDVHGRRCSACGAPLTTDLPPPDEFETDAECVYCGHVFGRVIIERDCE